MDYKIEAIDILLNETCILQRYYPLIQYKRLLIENLRKHHYFTKRECLNLSDETLIKMGLPNSESANLFRSFLTMYDIKESKLKEISRVAINEDEEKSFRELYLLPGVKAVRAKLYFDANYTSLSKIADATTEQIIYAASKVISQKNLKLKVPLAKEVRTHIAVAKVLTMYVI